MNRLMEPWIKAIPESPSHGSGTFQKRLWRLTSDYVRIRDWYNHKGVCIATGKKIDNWQEGQAGHFIPYSKCNGMFKFDVRNIYLQAAASNSWGGFDDWLAYAKELERRTGYTKEFLERENRDTSLKFSDADVIKQMIALLKRMSILPFQPPYYRRVMELRQEMLDSQ